VGTESGPGRDASWGSPVLSVLLPAYNAADTVRAAAESVLNGTTAALELIIVDDGSTDGTGAAVADLTSDERVRLISRPNKGLSASLNEAIAYASAPFIARMDADDVSMPDRFAAQLQFLTDHPDVVMVGGQIRRMIKGTAESTSHLPLEHDDIVTALLRGQHAICHPTVMIRRSALDRIGGYWDFGLAEDWDLYLRLSEVGRIANIDQHVLDYTFAESGINASSMMKVRVNIALAVRNHYRRTCGLDTLEPQAFFNDLTMSKRMQIRAESMSLGLYRRSLLAGTSSRVSKSVYLAGAAVSWPPFAVRRLKQAAHTT
jgi:glycosyltransferase involved in cell wall biosynthesis